MSFPRPDISPRFKPPVASKVRPTLQKLGRRRAEAAFGDHQHSVDLGSFNASGNYTGNIRFFKVDDLVFGYGTVDRATGFNATYHTIGITVPKGARPVAITPFPASPIFEGTITYRYRVQPSGAIEIQESAATSQNLTFNYCWSVV